MNRSRRVLLSRLALPVGLLLTPLWLAAQPSQAPSSVPPSANNEEVVVLSPFTVSAEKERGYLAGNAISGTKTNTALRDLPMSISVITSEMLADLNTVLPSESLMYSASVDFSQAGTTANSQGGPFNSGTTFVRGSGTFFNMRDGFRSYQEPSGFSVQRIEVVKGPSAVLYGITKPGGIVNYISKRPQFAKTKGEVSLGYGSYQTSRSSLDVNYGRLLDGKLAFRLGAAYNDINTWFTSSNGREWTILPSVAYKPFKSTEIMFQYEYTERVFAPNSTAYYTRPVTGYRGSSVPYFIYPTGPSDPVALLTPQLPAGLTPDFTVRGSGPKTRVPYKTGILTLTQEVGENLTLNAQYSKSRRNNWRQDFDTTAQFTGSLTDANAGNPVVGAPRIRRQWENRDAVNLIDNISLTAIYKRTLDLPWVGKVDNKLIFGYTSLEDNFEEWRVRQFNGSTTSRISYYYAFDRNIPNAGLPAGFPDMSATHYTTNDVTFPGVTGVFRRDLTQSAAEENKFQTLYASWAGNFFADRVILNAGIVSAEASQNRIAGAAATKTQADYEQNSPLLGAIFRPVKWASVYVQASKSFNPNTSARDGFSTPLPAETGKGSEFGVKFDPWDGRLSANIAVYHTVESNRFITDPNAPNANSFYIDSNGIQQPITGPNDPRYNPNLPGQNKGAGASVGEATTDGVDLEVVWSPTKRMQILSTYSYLDGRVTKDANIALANLKGRPLPNNYDHRATFLAKYRFTDGALKGLDVMLGATWRGKIFRDVINATNDSTTTIIDPVERYGDALWDGDFKLGYATKAFGHKIRFQFNAKNIFEKQVAVGWKPTTARTYSFEQYYYKVPASYAFTTTFEF